MVGQYLRGSMLVVTVLSLSASPASACHCFNRWFGAPATTTYYAPAPVAVAPAPPCGCAPAPTVVNYVPQTSYRTVYVNMPVVAYQPITTANPCTGCATTVMRPITSYVTQARLVPYTSYRPVVTAAYAPAVPACATPVTAAYAPSPIPVAAPAPAAPCCTAGYAAAAPPTTSVMRAVVQQPAVVAPTPAIPLSPSPAVAAPPSTVVPPTTVTPLSPSTPSIGTPSLTPIPPSTNPNRTFDEPSAAPGEPQSRVLRPQSGDSAPATVPRSLDPEDQDRTTYLPRLRAFAARPVSAPSAQPKASDDSAWRAARR